MNNLTTFQKIAEVSIIYKNKIPAKERIQIKSSIDIHTLMKPIYDEFMNHHEEFHVVLLNRGNHVLGVSKVSQGGISETTVDVRIILQLAIKTNATNIALCHNHPSGALKPSIQDKNLTDRIVKTGTLMNIQVIDHLIIGECGYYSFADDGAL